MPATNMHAEPRIVRSTNALISNFRILGYLYEYATGIKTGSTPEAGYCLAASATKNDRNLISVVMGCERVPGSTGSQGHTYFSETIRLFDWGFDNFSTQTMLDSSKRDIPEVEVSLGQQPSVTLMPEGEISALLPNDVSEENFTYQYTIDSPVVEAPVEAGQELGRITVSFNGQEYGILPWWPPPRWSGTTSSTTWIGCRSSLTTCWCASCWWSFWRFWLSSSSATCSGAGGRAAAEAMPTAAGAAIPAAVAAAAETALHKRGPPRRAEGPFVSTTAQCPAGASAPPPGRG